MGNRKISIIVPVYRTQEYLGRCVDSLVNQTYRETEIVLVDDGSPDSCPALCAHSIPDILRQLLLLRSTPAK